MVKKRHDYSIELENTQTFEDSQGSHICYAVHWCLI